MGGKPRVHHFWDRATHKKYVAALLILLSGDPRVHHLLDKTTHPRYVALSQKWRAKDHYYWDRATHQKYVALSQ
jgi:hypothetical protein